MGIDLDDFLEFYLLDSQEQIEKLGSGLLELERDGENISLVNDLFRSAHSLKGASGTMGFTPIVELTHAAEDLLDKLRQGKMLVTNEIIDVLLAVTDKVKMMLAQVGQRLAISVDYGDLTSQMKTITETGALAQESKPFAGKNQAEEKEDKPGVAFALSPEETGTVREAAFASKSVYRLNVVLEPNTMMKAVRAVMTIQRLELLGNVVKIIPSIDELEVSDALEFNMLFVTNESQEDIRADILEISEIFDVRVMNYTLPESDVNPIRTEKNVEEPASMSRSKQANQPVEQNNEQPQKDVNQVHTIRVDTARMDNLINLVGEMVITRTRLVKIGQDLQTENQSDPLVSNLNEANVYLGRLMNDLQESVMRLRMVPIGTIFSRYPRLVRDFCRKTGKRIELVIHGEETELDKIVIEMIGDPLTHIIRNSVDHGIEPPEERLTVGKPEAGTITLDAYHEGNHIAIIVSDDGAGLNLDKIYKKAVEKGLISEREGLSENDIANLIFLPGFSTADQITDISGRGVGMDVVKKAITNLGGIVDIKTSRGAGTSMIIRLPLTLAIIQALLVEVGNETYAVPLSSVVETLLVNKCDIKSVGSLPMVQLRGNTLPLISLKQKFDLPESAAIHDEVYVVVVGLGDKTVGLIVDELQGQQEVVIKSLGDYLNGLPGIAGATILGDGKVTLILDIGSLLQDILIKH
ncbi:MAG: chemotaxis protein CheA [Dehalobacter sp.]|nr:chemotaxis protein CheA [Dehalobacter sp.]OCZ52409.1 chemotaxis protein CheA [Dehalobacter sp. TeCB1]QHA01946.1 chemotaxis protein CheA [Dehalobacter restrictus]